ncbi:hypothetical protein ACVWWO_007378 [Bradyrhizobium sp. F1.13.1]
MIEKTSQNRFISRCHGRPKKMAHVCEGDILNALANRWPWFSIWFAVCRINLWPSHIAVSHAAPYRVALQSRAVGHIHLHGSVVPSADRT